VSAEAARLASPLRALASHAIGIDTASIDHGPSRDFPRASPVLGNADVHDLSRYLDRTFRALPPRGALFIGLPMEDRRGQWRTRWRAVAVLP
jgi:hypothetical protein